MIGDSLSNVESLKVSLGFINISSNREIIDGNLSQLVLWINDEKTTECRALVFLENTIAPADGHVLVSHERDQHIYKISLLAAPLTPGKVGKVRVSGAGNDSTVVELELSSSVIECLVDSC